MNVAGKLREVTPVVQAAIVLLALSILKRLGLLAPTPTEVLAALGASRSRAYELSGALAEGAAELARPRGRPAKEKPVVPVDRVLPVVCAVRDYLMAHPGAVSAPGQRQQYSGGFRDFALRLLGPDGLAAGLSLEQAAHALGVPANTLKDWLRLPKVEVGDAAASPLPPADGALPQGVSEHIVELWRHWKGDLTAFCAALRSEHRLQVSLHQVRQLLALTGLREPRRRRTPNPDPEAIRGALERFFPGAQWVADGKRIVVQIGAQRFAFTWELVVDAADGAHVGFAVRDAEDSQGLLDALEHGEQTTGAHPLALLRDNLPANHSDEVEAALCEHEVISMPSTVSRPENKASCEGAFGLFAQKMPPLVLPDGPPRQVARTALATVLFAFCAGRNHVPRKRLGGRSAAETYAQAQPSEQEREAARERLRAIRQRLLDQREADRRRAHPACLELLTRAFEELGLRDPEGRFVTAIARYGFDAAAEAVAILRTKREQGRLDTDFPERYLLGIARNVAQRREDEAVYHHLVDLRARHNDALLRPLLDERRRLERQHEGLDYLEDALAHALRATATLDRRFWLRDVLRAFARLPDSARRERAPWLARRIARALHVPALERDGFLAQLAVLVTDPLGA
jgi:hypothetical protein